VLAPIRVNGKKLANWSKVIRSNCVFKHLVLLYNAKTFVDALRGKNPHIVIPLKADIRVAQHE
jgi:hypothetical protein